MYVTMIKSSTIQVKNMNEMNRIFLAILKAAVRSEQPQLQENLSALQWQTLINMAKKHKVLPLFYEAICDQLPAAADSTLLTDTKREMRRQVIQQTMRTAEFLELNDLLTASGIKPLVVKGIVCRSLYARPDHRPSGDEDILIPESEFETCHRILTDFGMAVQRQTSTYEVPYFKNGSSLYIELHKSLFPPESEAYGDLNRFFDGVQARAVAVDLHGHAVYTLAPTDHLFYLICHAFKHFLHSGFGIHQVCDIVLYANTYITQVDWTGILENCKAIRADKFAAAVFVIGKNNLGFEIPHIWQTIEVNEQPMLNDLLEAGVYGDATMSRKHSSNITLDALAAQKSGRKAKGGFATSAFPSASKLQERYPYLKKHRYMLPVAWASRLWTYTKESHGRRDNNAADALKIGAERVELMKFYGIIEP